MIFAAPPARLPNISDIATSFYHVTDLPEGVTTSGQWDLRGRVDDYLGRVNFAGRRVLEIGPASGFLTAEMERRGADVVTLDLPEDYPWDFVPFPEDVMRGVRDKRLNKLRLLRNTFWYTHKAFGLKAKAVYADAYNVPRELGRFDVAVLAAVLLHVGDPHRVIASCARLADTIIITDVFREHLNSCGPVIRFNPTPENKEWGLWWHLTPSFVMAFLAVLGFEAKPFTCHKQRNARVDAYDDLFTVVASRSGSLMS